MCLLWYSFYGTRYAEHGMFICRTYHVCMSSIWRLYVEHSMYVCGIHDVCMLNTWRLYVEYVTSVCWMRGVRMLNAWRMSSSVRPWLKVNYTVDITLHGLSHLHYRYRHCENDMYGRNAIAYHACHASNNILSYEVEILEINAFKAIFLT